MQIRPEVSGEYRSGCTLDGRYLLGDVRERWIEGALHRAELLATGVPVDVLILDPSLTGCVEARRSFREEGRALARFGHPAFVRVLDVGCEGGPSFWSFDPIGVAFHDFLREVRLSDQRALGLAVVLAEAVVAAEEAGHPPLLLAPEEIRLRASGSPSSPSAGANSMGLVSDDSDDVVVQIVSLGGRAHRGVGRSTPIERAEIQALGRLYEQLFAGRDMPRALNALIARCLDPSPRARPRGARQLARLLRDIELVPAPASAGGEPTRRFRAHRTLAPVVTSLVALALLWFGLRSPVGANKGEVLQLRSFAKHDMAEVILDLERELRADVASNRRRPDVYDHLRLYRLLTNAPSPDSAALRAWATARLRDRVDDGPVLQAYLASREVRPAPDEALVAVASVAATPTPEQLSRELVAGVCRSPLLTGVTGGATTHASGPQDDIMLFGHRGLVALGYDEHGGATVPFVVPAHLTRAGFQCASLWLDDGDGSVRLEPWVIGVEAADESRVGFWAGYAREYVLAWRELVRFARSDQPGQPLLARLAALLEPGPHGMGGVFELVRAHTALVEDRARCVEWRAVPRRQAPATAAEVACEVTEEFVGFLAVSEARSGGVSELDLYLEQLSYVHDVMRYRSMGAGTAREERERVDTARRVTEAMIARQYPVWQPRLAALLVPPLDEARRELDGHR